MQATIQFKAKDRLEKFLTWIQNRAKSDTHKENVALISEFIDKVVKVELNRLEHVNSVINETIEIPFTLNENPPEKKVHNTIPLPPKPRSGNGHKSEKKRPLSDSEKNFIRSEFMKLNGQFEEDACVSIKNKLDPDVAIFQVTGFVTYIHLQIARGEIEVPDMNSYLKFIQKHRNKWATYNSPKYQRMRHQRKAA